MYNEGIFIVIIQWNLWRGIYNEVERLGGIIRYIIRISEWKVVDNQVEGILPSRGRMETGIAERCFGVGEDDDRTLEILSTFGEGVTLALLALLGELIESGENCRA